MLRVKICERAGEGEGCGIEQNRNKENDILSMYQLTMLCIFS